MHRKNELNLHLFIIQQNTTFLCASIMQSSNIHQWEQDGSKKGLLKVWIKLDCWRIWCLTCLWSFALEHWKASFKGRHKTLFEAGSEKKCLKDEESIRLNVMGPFIDLQTGDVIACFGIMAKLSVVKHWTALLNKTYPSHFRWYFEFLVVLSSGRYCYALQNPFHKH